MSTENLFPYAPGPGIAKFDPASPLPDHVKPTRRYLANLGLLLLPAQPFPPMPPKEGTEPGSLQPGQILLGIQGSLGLMDKDVTAFMPPNLTRLHPDKFSDEFFVERRLNGFNPGKLNKVQNKPWQYAVRYDCSKYQVEPAGILPKIIEARFCLNAQKLNVHSIEFTMNGKPTIQTPGDEEWEQTKRLFRCAEFVLQESQSHLARTHMNMDQYAMAYYRNVVNNPIKELLEPHLEGLININKLGASLIIGDKGFIPEASALEPASINDLIEEEIRHLTYRNWNPSVQKLPDFVANNYFDPAAIAMWELLTEYVDGFISHHRTGIEACWNEIQDMSKDLSSHAILKPELGKLDILGLEDLAQLCVYVIYISSFFHSWVNNKQYEDGGDVDYAVIGLWDSQSPHYDPVQVATREAKQASLLWTLSNVRYNPILEAGPGPLKDLIWARRDVISPGLPVEDIMMSINI
ncbi:lipoxygenase family protein [Acaryochloris marina]|uniref:lipoxygenase family protein n=1 Tax=Acaryochloris marina TaxID=155978 RepID=UPI001BAF4D39|nr:lipoxygenase family protein [Acaryochloris marina]QUY41380.1 hypothetical protein I1H34_19220 [Acaryochloris marina S15]